MANNKSFQSIDLQRRNESGFDVKPKVESSPASKVPPPPKEQTNVAKYPLFINGTENTKLSLELYTTQLVASLSKESVISSEITGMNNHIKYDII